jgi:threonine synthase
MNITFICKDDGTVYEKPPKNWLCGPDKKTPVEIFQNNFSYKSILGEGNTPLVQKKRLYFKLEYLNPSGSFKDRGVSYTIQYFLNNGCRNFVEDSSGNTGISTALYTTFIEGSSTIFVPKTISPAKENLLNLLGAKIIKCSTREEAYIRAIEYLRKEENTCYIGHMVNPLFIEGISHMIDELPRHVLEKVTDIIVPVSSGSLILGICNSFIKNDWRLPRLWAVQPVENSYLAGSVKTFVDPKYSGETSSLADALVVKNPPRMQQVIKCIKNSGGGVVLVGNMGIIRGLKQLYKMGFIIEPSSAIVWRAYEILLEEKKVDVPLIPLTGSGLKYVELLSSIIS